MARKKERAAVPTAPIEVSRFTALKWAALGRRDARRYGALLDFTTTHSLIRAAGEAQRGQHNVNSWLVTELGPDLTGNERIVVSMRKAREEFTAVSADRTTSPRAQHQNAMRLARLDNQLSNLEAQWRANIAKGRGTIQIAEQALGTWEKYYFQVAAVYTRARANASSRDVSSVQSEVPSFDSVPIVEIPGFDHDDLPTVGKARK